MTLVIIFTHLARLPINGFNPVIRKFIHQIGQMPPLVKAVSMGLLTPLLPCGLLYAALSMSLMLTSPQMAFWAMTSFALGTSLPMLLAQIGLQKAISKSTLYANILTKTVAVISLLLSIYFLYRH